MNDTKSFHSDMGRKSHPKLVVLSLGIKFIFLVLPFVSKVKEKATFKMEYSQILKLAIYMVGTARNFM